jgi:hypothetical protein
MEPPFTNCRAAGERAADRDALICDGSCNRQNAALTNVGQTST